MELDIGDAVDDPFECSRRFATDLTTWIAGYFKAHAGTREFFTPGRHQASINWVFGTGEERHFQIGVRSACCSTE